MNRHWCGRQAPGYPAARSFIKAATDQSKEPNMKSLVTEWKRSTEEYRGCRRLLLGALVLVSFGSMAMSAENNTATNPPPDFLYNKPRLPDALLKDKREGRYTTGFPAIGWD